MAMRFRVGTLTCVVAILVGVSSAYGQDATLRYRWVKGDEVRYRLSQQGNTTVTGLPGVGEMTNDQSNVQVFHQTVEDVAADGSATLRQTFESVRMEMSSPAGKAVFDSAAADKPTDPIAAAMGMTMSAMIGESITIVVLPTGAVIRVEGMSRILDKILKTLPQNPALGQTISQLEGIMGDDAMRSLFEQSFVKFPDRAVKTGETWTGQFKMSNPMFGALTTTLTSTLKGVESGNGASIARITAMIAVTQDAEAKGSGLPGMTAKLADSKGEGEMLFDITKGRLQKSSFKSEMPVTMSLAGPSGSPINSQMLVRNTITLEIVEK
jgi:Family of unknown function (DUF6263)